MWTDMCGLWLNYPAVKGRTGQMAERETKRCEGCELEARVQILSRLWLRPYWKDRSSFTALFPGTGDDHMNLRLSLKGLCGLSQAVLWGNFPPCSCVPPHSPSLCKFSFHGEVLSSISFLTKLTKHLRFTITLFSNFSSIGNFPTSSDDNYSLRDRALYKTSK